MGRESLEIIVCPERCAAHDLPCWRKVDPHSYHRCDKGCLWQKAED